MARHRGRDPEAIVDQYARDLLRDWGVNDLPVNVDALASGLGIRRQLASYPFAGRVYVEPSGQLVMNLNADDSPPRQRFTCGHEIIHTVFPGFKREFRYRLDAATGRHDVRRGEEEFLCDHGAAELLMPGVIVREQYRLSAGLDAVETLAMTADVSLEAAGNRLVSLSESQAVFVVLEVAHKPADTPALRKGIDVPKRLRVRYATSSGAGLHVPRFKSAEDDSVFVRALQSGGLEEGEEQLPGSSNTRPYRLQARVFPKGDGSGEMSRVLAVGVAR
jgi:hypothetical protein